MIIRGFLMSSFVLACGFFVSCKPRNDYAKVQSAGNELGEANLSEQKVKEIESLPAEQISSAIDAACKNGPKSLFLDKESNGSLRYSTSATVKEPIQVNWDSGLAKFVDGRWKLTNSFSAVNLPECIRGENLLSTRAFLVALNCASVDPCPLPPAGCANGECVKSDPPLIAFNYESRIGAGSNNVSTEQLALTGDDIQCADKGGRYQMKGDFELGAPVESIDACEKQKQSKTGNLICAWSGSAFVPYSLTSGKAVSIANDMGTKDLQSCASAISFQKANLVCGWNGLGYSPISFGKGAVTLVGEPVKMDLAACQDQLSTVKGDLFCAKTKDDYFIYNVGTGLPVSTKVSFTSRDLCVMAISLGGKLEAKTYDMPVPNADQNGDRPEKPSLGLLGVGYTLGSCQVSDWWYHIAAHTKDGNGTRWLKDGCQIDTLYSWGPWAKVQYMGDNAANGVNWSGRFVRDGKDSPLFASNSPIATFGYGDYAIRIKLKWNTNYKVYADDIEGYDPYKVCRTFLSAAEVEMTVVVRYWNKDHGSGLDYILCGPGPIHSWSYGTREHYDEITRETNWVNANNYKDYELYYKKKGVDQLIGPSLDGHSFSSATWSSNLSKYASLLNSKNSRISFNKSAGNSGTTANHFNTKIPIYFNPD